MSITAIVDGFNPEEGSAEEPIENVAMIKGEGALFEIFLDPCALLS